MTAKGTKFIKVAISPEQAERWLTDRGRMHHDMTESIINQVKKEFPNLLSEREREWRECQNAQTVVVRFNNSTEANEIRIRFNGKIDVLRNEIQSLENERNILLTMYADQALLKAGITNYKSTFQYGGGVVKCDAENAAKNTSSSLDTVTAVDSTGQSPNGSDLPKDNPPNG